MSTLGKQWLKVYWRCGLLPPNFCTLWGQGSLKEGTVQQFQNYNEKNWKILESLLPEAPSLQYFIIAAWEGKVRLWWSAAPGQSFGERIQFDRLASFTGFCFKSKRAANWLFTIWGSYLAFAGQLIVRAVGPHFIREFVLLEQRGYRKDYLAEEWPISPSDSEGRGA